MLTGTGAATVISIRGDIDCALRVRRIASCLAESVGMDIREARETAARLADECERAIACREDGSLGQAVITLRATASGVTAEVAGPGALTTGDVS